VKCIGKKIGYERRGRRRVPRDQSGRRTVTYSLLKGLGLRQRLVTLIRIQLAKETALNQHGEKKPAHRAGT